MDKVLSVDECINGIFSEIENRREVDYASRSSVRRYNAAYDRMLGYVMYIDRHYPEQIPLLLDLLNHPNISVVQACAPMILGMSNSTKAQKELALDAIRKIAVSPDIDEVDRLGFSMSLPGWEKLVQSE